MHEKNWLYQQISFGRSTLSLQIVHKKCHNIVFFLKFCEKNYMFLLYLLFPASE